MSLVIGTPINGINQRAKKEGDWKAYAGEEGSRARYAFEKPKTKELLCTADVLLRSGWQESSIGSANTKAWGLDPYLL